MRSLLALVLLAPLAAGCTPYIPERLDFGTSALAPTGDIPPEYAGFNNYDPNVNAVMAQQICATSYVPRTVTTPTRRRTARHRKRDLRAASRAARPLA